MERVAEEELMDAADQARAYAEADFEEVNQRFADRYLELWPEGRGQRVLDLGCGPADIPIRMCRADPQLSVCGVDGAWAMLAMGLPALAASGAAHRIQLVQAYLPDLPFRSASFEAVVSNSLLHHLADPNDLWTAVRRFGKPGCPVLVCDLFRPESQAAARKIVDDTECSSAILEVDFYNSLLAAYRVDEVREQLERAGLAHLDVEIVSERHLLVWGRL